MSLTDGGGSEFTVRDVIGDEGSALLDPAFPSITCTPDTVTQGATYNSSNPPGFTFSAPYSSVSDITYQYTTLGSTVPDSLKGALSGSSITLSGADPSVFVPYTPPDDGKIAPDRYLVVSYGSQATYLHNPHAIMKVVNNDVPTITINDASDNAVIQLDPQGDIHKLTKIATSAPNFDQEILTSTLTWSARDFIMWPTDEIGPAGTDLAGVAGAVYNPADGTVSITVNGAPPADVYGQCIAGSINWDTTMVQLSVQVEAAPTAIVGESSKPASATAKGTARGVVIVGGGATAGGAIPQIVIGERMNLSAQWEGPGAPATDASLDWSGSGSVVKGFYVSPDFTTGGPQALQPTTMPFANNSLSFIWYSERPDGRIEKVNCSVAGFTTSQQFHVMSPSSQVNVLSGDDNPGHTTSSQSIHSGASARVSLGTVTLDGRAIAGKAGVEFSAFAEEPANFENGNYEWVQIINSSRISPAYQIFGHLFGTSFLSGLDNTYAYDKGDPQPLTHSKARVDLNGKELREVTETVDSPSLGNSYGRGLAVLNFSMWLMYEPNNAGPNDWVPLQIIDWDWRGSWHLSNNNHLMSATFVTDIPIQGSLANAYPKWSQIVRNS